MRTEVELGAQRKKRMVTTYGKATRKRQPKAVFTPVTASESLSEEDSVVASDSNVARHQPPPEPSPEPKPPAARVRTLGGTRETQTAPASSQSIVTTDRKRKASQIYRPRQRLQPATDEPEEKGPPSAPESRRPRIAQPEMQSTTKSGGRERTRIQQRAPSDSMDIVPAGPRLSSPPPTPTPPRVSKPITKPPSTYVSKQKSTNAPSENGTQKQHSRQQQQIPLHLARDPDPITKRSNAPPTTSLKEKSPCTAIDKPLGFGSVKKPRKRLIDVLVEQESNDVTTMSDDMADVQVTSSQTIPSQSSNTSELDDSGLPETPKPKTRTAPAAGVRTFARSSSALKFTYGQGRKVLEEEDNLLESLALPTESSYSRRCLDLGGPKKSAAAATAFDHIDDDGTANNSPGSKLRGIHELRQAGANSRVADEMQDLIDQIGAPGTGSSSSRRAALLQVAEKMRDKNFVRQCHDHDVESSILKDIGNETDTICSYLILASLVAIISGRTSGRLPRVSGAGPVFARLLSISEDIKKVAKDRKNGLSKHGQNSIATIESLLRELPLWDGDRPSFISPRSLAVKCLQLLIVRDVHICRDPTIFTKSVTDRLFDVLSDAASAAEYWDYPKTAQSVELCSALSVLEAHAVSVALTQGGSEWAIPYLGIIADAFYMSLQTPAEDGKTLEGLVLKLTINVANNNHAAADVFASRSALLAALAISISSSFNQALAFISQDASVEGILDSLVLRLGILINFAEHSGLVRQLVNDYRGDDREPVKELIRLFNENHRRTGEADSMEKTHLNVAFGYLSVLLGYLALYKPVRQKLISSHSARSIGPLVGSIREFIAHYEQVENTMSDGDEDDHRRGGYADQLQELVQQLEDQAVHD